MLSDSAVHLRVTQQKLDSAQIAGLLVDLRHLGPSHRMRAIGARFETHRSDPPPYDPGVLSCRKMRAPENPARPQKLEAKHFRVANLALQ